ncbi:hypothetical protein SeMB42_g04413 [Synchytrium endobioticum]|uniref:Ribosomal protein S3 C-terminal domain-containing protein n=1 Tax=Synchytrium endobioticum TaxID=286115 RepID=A0A507CYG4_9FUNG|nr:hypothetical protein SeMB42_g04413 [Synchytrium endobioticum]TPX46034.1 hypothetical protein SeLEV6574_g03477 [Synchytrium endobioticum]
MASTSVSRLPIYKNFIDEMARISAKTPRISTWKAPLVRPPKNLNMHLYKRYPFPNIPNFPIGSRQDMWERFLRIKSEQHNHRIAKRAAASINYAYSDDLSFEEDASSAEVQQGDDEAGVGDAFDDIEKKVDGTDKTISCNDGSNTIESSRRAGSPQAKTAEVHPLEDTTPTTQYIQNVPLPRVIQRHIMKPVQQLANVSALGKIVGFRIQVSGRKTTRTATDTVRYGRLATGQQGQSHVDFGRSSYVTRRGVTGVKVWISYAT